MDIDNQSDHSALKNLKNVAMFGFSLTTVLTLINIKYDGKGSDLFENHKVTITVSLSVMLVAVCVSTAVKLHHGLLPPWARLALSRASIFCVFQALFMLGSIVLFDKTPQAWFVLCIFPMFLLPLEQLREWSLFRCPPNPFKQLKERGWFRSPWPTVQLPFEGFRKLFFGKDEQQTETKLPETTLPV